MAVTMMHEDDEDSCAGTDISALDVMSAGSVTSFVRKLFQMVQGESDSIVGFVSDGTAFEVKDPRRLEQDILPKYFRHSRFQSLVRQLNFYSFKKISKERSVWIYKHAFFRRDEPELLHALKRKTNQHGTPTSSLGVRAPGAVDGEDDVILDRPLAVVDRSLSRDAHDSNKPRSRGPSFLPRHTGSSSTGSAFLPQHLQHQQQYPRQQHPQHPHHRHHTSPPSFGNHHHHQYHNGGGSGSGGSAHLRPSQDHFSAPRKSGGGSGSGRVYHALSSRSTGGGAVPSYGGQGPSSQGGGGASGYGGAGTGGRPVSSGSGQVGSGADYERSRNRSGGSMAHHARGSNRQGPAMGDTTSGERGAPRRSQGGGNCGPATGGAAISSDKEQALAIWGLSALCQAASSAAEAPVADDEATGGGSCGGGSRRLFDHNGNGDGTSHQQQKRHKAGASPAAAAAAARGRRGWERVRDESSDGGGDEEDGITSAEREDSSASVHRRSPSNSSFISSSSSSSSSSRRSISVNGSVVRTSADRSTHSNSRQEGQQTLVAIRRNRGGDRVQAATGARIVSQRPRQQQPTGGSGGVFCPTWDWGRAACEPAIRLPGSFVDRRFEEVDQQVGDGAEMDDEEDEKASSKTEEGVGDYDDEQEQDAAARGEKTAATAAAEVSTSQSETMRTMSALAAAVASGPRDLRADVEAEKKVGLEGIGTLFNQFCGGGGDDLKFNTNASESVFLATVKNSGDGGLREMAVFCAGPAGEAPDEAPPTSLAQQVSLFLQKEATVAQDLRVYAEALDPAAVDVVGRTAQQSQSQSPQYRHQLSHGEEEAGGSPLLSKDGAKLLRVFCRFAACRLGRALEVASYAAAAAAAPPGECPGDVAAGGGEEARAALLQHGAVAQRVSPRLDQCRWKWWRAAVRFS